MKWMSDEEILLFHFYDFFFYKWSFYFSKTKAIIIKGVAEVIIMKTLWAWSQPCELPEIQLNEQAFQSNVQKKNALTVWKKNKNKNWNIHPMRLWKSIFFSMCSFFVWVRNVNATRKWCINTNCIKSIVQYGSMNWFYFNHIIMTCFQHITVCGYFTAPVTLATRLMHIA